MMQSPLETPPKGLSLLATVGGVVSAIAIIVGAELWSAQLHRTQPQANPSMSGTHSVSPKPVK